MLTIIDSDYKQKEYISMFNWIRCYFKKKQKISNKDLWRWAQIEYKKDPQAAFYRLQQELNK